MLARGGAGYRSPAHCNTPWHVVRNVLRTRPWHAFSVAELPGAGAALFPLDDLLGMIRPDIGVVTSIGSDHYSVFRTLDAAAAHKGKVVDSLSADGVAVLNADDPRVALMRRRCRGRVITCGISPEATLRASDVSGAWPDRLSFVASFGAESVRVQTRLCGTHWVPSVLIALAVGQVLGIPIESAAEAIASMPPFPGRMSPVTTAEGITFIRDDEKAPLWTVDAALDFMKAARAPRKVAVFGTISDFAGTDRPKVVAAGRRALECVDVLVGVGPHGPYYLRAGLEMQRPAHAWATAGQARAFLRQFLRPGDLVLLKGSTKADGLERIVAEWAEIPEPLPPSDQPARAKPAPGPGAVRIVVGLGNADPRYALSPHNVGQRALGVLASRTGATWQREPGVSVATAVIDGVEVRLAKFDADMNDTGESLRHFAQRLGAAPQDCLVVHDDMDLPPGTVRWRPRGSAGGHRGLASILVALQSEQVRRVKIGVGRPAPGRATAFVLAPMDPRRQAMVDSALDGAADLILEALAASAAHPGRTVEGPQAGVPAVDPAGGDPCDTCPGGWMNTCHMPSRNTPRAPRSTIPPGSTGRWH